MPLTRLLLDSNYKRTGFDVSSVQHILRGAVREPFAHHPGKQPDPVYLRQHRHSKRGVEIVCVVQQRK